MWTGIIAGIISGLVVSILLFVLSHLLFRPNLKISNKICKSESTGNYKIKIVNDSIFDAVNLSYSLSSLKRKFVFGNMKTFKHRIYPKDDTFTYIPKSKNFKGYNRNIIIVAFDKEQIDQYLTEDNTFEFVISVEHAVSRIGKTFVRQFTKNDIVTGHFTACDYLDVIPKLDYEKNSTELSKN